MNPEKQKAYQRLKELLEEAEHATYDWTSTGKSKEWKQNVRAGLRRIFGKDSQHLAVFDAVRYGPIMFTSGTPDSVFHESFLSGIRTARAIIRSAIQEVEDYELTAPPSSPQGNAKMGNPSATTLPRKVFLVHGQDEEMKQTVARFLEALDFEVLILHEQASGGATIIEKFERNSEVPFAVVLLSPDDVGARNTGKAELRPRARQNVILELGYFIGRLGRTRVCAVVRGPLEIPSDFHGIVYIPYQGDDWKIQVVRELKHVGFDIDANEAF